jgi:hypothetical protein
MYSNTKNLNSREDSNEIMNGEVNIFFFRNFS